MKKIKARMIYWRNKYWGKPRKPHVQKELDWDGVEFLVGSKIINRPK